MKSSTYWARRGSEALCVALLLGCSDAVEDDPPLEGEGFCKISEQVFDADDAEVILGDELRIGDLVTGLSHAQLDLRWSAWADDYLEPPPSAGSPTTMHLALEPATMMITLRDSAYDDDICHDRLEIRALAAFSTDDGVFTAAALDVVVYVDLRTSESRIQLFAEPSELGTSAVWPEAEPRPAPEEVFVELDATRSAIDLSEGSWSKVRIEMQHVWYVISEGGYVWRVLESFALAELAAP